MTTLKDAVFQALGEASMCWSDIPAGVFDSIHAAAIGDRLMATIEQEQPSPLAIEAIKGQIVEALQTDGAQHKQYFLWKIADILNLDVSAASDEKGVAP